MLVSIGPRKSPEDLVGLLLECHQRIRAFTGLAEDIGRREDLTDADMIDGCSRCERYFTEALPLHVEDEEESLLPRLRERSQEVDAALQTMHAQHEEHGPLLESVLEALRAVRRDPDRRSDAAEARSHREQLRVAAARLRGEFEKHLTLEEQVIFPAAGALLTSQDHAAIMDELRARRQRGQ